MIGTIQKQLPLPDIIALVVYVLMNGQAPVGLSSTWIYCYVLFALARQTPAFGVPKTLLSITVWPVALVLLGTLGILSHPKYLVLKDCWYFLNPVLFIAFGYLFYQRTRNLEALFTAFAVGGLIAAIGSLIQLFIHRNELIAASTVNQYRSISGFGLEQAMVPIAIIWICRAAKMSGAWFTGSRWRFAVLSVCLIDVALSLSRTLLICLLIAALLTIRRRILLLLVLFGSPILAAALLFVPSFPSTNIFGLFMAKLINSRSELKIADYQTWEDINVNWRGFEAYQALRTFDRFSVAHKIIGGGFGETVDIGFPINLGGNELEDLPILHNGYMYVLIKDGILGELFLVLFGAELLRRSIPTFKSDRPAVLACGKLIVWTVLVLVITQQTSDGLVNPESGLAFIIVGAACAFLANTEGRLSRRVQNGQYAYA